MNTEEFRQIQSINETVKREKILIDEINRIKRTLKDVSNHIRIVQATKYTGWTVLLQLIDGKWTCVGVVNPDVTPEGQMPDEWDLAVPIPDPATVPEFQGW